MTIGAPVFRDGRTRASPALRTFWHIDRAMAKCLRMLGQFNASTPRMRGRVIESALEENTDVSGFGH